MDNLIATFVLMAALLLAACSANIPQQASLFFMNDTAMPVTVTINYRADNGNQLRSFTLDAGRGDLWEYNQGTESDSGIFPSIIGVVLETAACSRRLNHQELESAVDSNAAHHLLIVNPTLLNCAQEQDNPGQ